MLVLEQRTGRAPKKRHSTILPLGRGGFEQAVSCCLSLA